MNGLEWVPATTTNGWTNWTIIYPLIAGTNKLHAIAIDWAGNRSATSGCLFIPRTHSC